MASNLCSDSQASQICRCNTIM